LLRPTALYLPREGAPVRAPIPSLSPSLGLAPEVTNLVMADLDIADEFRQLKASRQGAPIDSDGQVTVALADAGAGKGGIVFELSHDRSFNIANVVNGRAIHRHPLVS
jgi:hypothetical protein